MNPLSDLPLLLVDLEIIRHMNTPDDENTVFTLDLPYGFGSQAAIACWNVARLQRAPKSADQSTGGRSHNIIKCGGVRLLRSCVYPIVLCHLRVEPEEYRLLVYRKIGPTQRTPYTLYPDY